MLARRVKPIIGICFLLFGLNSFAQTDTVIIKKNQVLLIADSLFIPQNDTTIFLKKGAKYQIRSSKYVLSQNFYDSIYKRAKETRLTKELYELLITQQAQENPFDNTEPIRSEAFFEEYRDKIINKISYTPVDLFGGSVNDTTRKATSDIGKLTNELHSPTLKRVIMKHLLFEKGDRINPYKLADTERIIRSLKYIEDVRIVLTPDPINKEAVNINIVVKDRFPWSIDFSTNEGEAYRAGFTNQNILGMGNEFGIGYFYARDEKPKHGYDVRYTIRNIKNSFVDGTVFVSDNYEGKSKGILLKRDFLSPNIKYYGEFKLEHAEPIIDLVFADSIYTKDFAVDRNSYDFWGGRSFRLGNRKTINTAIRLQHDDFNMRPTVQADSNTIFQNHHFLLSALSYSKINFLKTKNILSFNITEDVPIGFNYAILLGRDWTEFGTRIYRGFQSSYSEYNKRFGYFLVNFETGYFIQNKKQTEQVIQIDGRHFTPLFEVGSAYSRIFTRFHYFNGNRLPIPLSQSLAFQNRIRNIEGNQIRGNRLTTLTVEYVVFQPWYFYGFRFATFGNLGIGNVKESRAEIPYNKVYYSLGGGVRIRNESLVFNTFELGLSLFPNAPVEGQTFYIKVNLRAPQFFQGPNIRKPKLVGID